MKKMQRYQNPSNYVGTVATPQLEIRDPNINIGIYRSTALAEYSY